jgi:hypothetical protein
MRAGVQASYPRALFAAGLIVATSFIVASGGPASSSPSTSPAQKARITENYAKLPLIFEANSGQTNSAVKFLSRGRGYTLFLTSDEAVLALRGSKIENRKSKIGTATGAPRTLIRRPEPAKRGFQSQTPDPHACASAVLGIRLIGANPAAQVRGEEELPGKANYFIGNDPKKWRSNVPTYGQVRYADIYPGIDLIYYGNQSASGQLEFDFAVAPGANPRPIRLRFAGPNRLHLAPNGDVVVTTADGALAFHKPLVYQMADGHRHPVAGDFTLLGKHTVAFRLGSYDRAQALVIDPVLVYSTFLGGSALFGDKGNAIAVDAAGNVYVAGQTYSADFPVTQGAYQTTNNAAANQFTNIFVSKLNASGTALLYSTYLGGSGTLQGGDSAHAMAVDAAGNVYVAGQTYSTDFPVSPGAFQTTNRAAAEESTNAFVAKLNATGTALVYSTYLGGSGGQGNYTGDKGNAIAVDAAGNVYVAGQTYSTDFPVTPGAFQTTNQAAASNLTNAFITKLNPTGTALVYSTYLGGSGGYRGGYAGDMGNAIAVDTAGNGYVAGATFSSDFPVTSGAFQSANNALANQGTNAFITKLNPTGTVLVYSTYLGGSGADAGNAIAADTAGDAYVAGQTGSIDFPVTQGAFQTTNHRELIGGVNAFVTKLNPAGSALVYSTYLGGSGGVVNQSATLFFRGGDLASGLAIDSSGNAYVTGSTASANFPVTSGAYQTTNHDQPGCVGGCIGGYNAFITELNSTGSALVYSTYLGGRGLGLDFGLIEGLAGDQANALALDSSGNVYVTGSAQSFDFPVTAGTFQMMVASWCGNAFVTKLNMGAPSTATTPIVTVTPASSSITSGKPLTVTVSVSGGSGNLEPTGTVTLLSGLYASAATTLSGGGATITIPAGSPSTDWLIAMYVPDAASSSIYNFSSGVGSVNVVGPNISVTPSTSTLSWAQAQSQALPVAIALTVASGYPTPTGTVSLTIGSWTSAAAALSVSNATINIPPGTLPLGLDSVNVNYSGDSNYAAMAGVPATYVTVGVLTVSVVPASSSINMNQALPVTITVSEVSGGPTPTGTVTLNCGGYTSAATPLTNGSVTITIPAGSLLPGTDSLLADYTGGNYSFASGHATVRVTGSPPGFTITGTAVTVTPGVPTGNTSTVTVTSSGGFTGSVALTAAVTSSPIGAQNPPTLSFGSTSPVSITGTAAGAATLTIATTAPSLCTQAYQTPRGVFWYTGGGTALACVLLFIVTAKRRRWRTALCLLALLVALTGGWLACGGGTVSPPCTPNAGTTSGSYIITVTGTSGTTSATATVALTVQ